MSIDSIQKKVNAFLASPAGKKKVEKARKEAVKAGRPFGRIVVDEKYAQRMKAILSAEVSEIKNRYGEAFLDYIEISDEGLTADGKYCFNVGFIRSEMERESLDPASYPEGVDNLAALYTHGYDTGGKTVVGYDSHGTFTESNPHRDPDNFMKRAVEKFNQEFGDKARAVLDEAYQ